MTGIQGLVERRSGRRGAAAAVRRALASALALAALGAFGAFPGLGAGEGASAATLPAAAATDAAAVAAAPAESAGAVEWSVAPADESGADGRVSLRHVVPPGDVAEDAIVVQNLGAASAEFAVHAGDGVIGAGGAFDVATEEPRDAGAWIEVGGLDAGRLALDAGEARVLPVTVRVPADATPGDHPAGIVVGVRSESGGVGVTQRIGVRLHLQVAGELAPAIEVARSDAAFEPSWMPFAPGTLRLDVELRNAGNVRLGGAVSAQAAGPFGVFPVQGRAEAVELLPGGSTTAVLEVPAWPLLLLSGAVTVAPTAIGDDRVPMPAAEQLPVRLAAISWTGLVLVVLLALLVVVLVRRGRRRRRAEELASADGSTAPAAGAAGAAGRADAEGPDPQPWDRVPG